MNIFKKTFFEVIAIIAFLTLVIVILNFFIDQPEPSFLQAQLGEKSLSLEIADTPFLRRVGLSGRERLEDGKGMLFIYEKEMERISFWMKDTLIPLDIIFFDSDFKVVHIIENVPVCEENPCPNYGYEGLAQYALELNAGWVEENGLELGSYLVHNSSNF